jgi:DNA (cytosine-5)-methyltransferase 1
VRLLDLFCGAGGAAMGYSRAGFDDIIGVDIKDQPRYPFTFIRGDALAFVALHGHQFDAIHASPPCQTFSKTRAILRGKGLQNRGVDLIDLTRDALDRLRARYVIENVPGAPLRAPVKLCGQMFGLRVIRHRLFEMSPYRVVMTSPHPHVGGTNSHRGYSRGAAFVTVGGHNYNFKDGANAMGIDWMTRDELNEAIPPAYTEFIGKQLLEALK